MLLMLVLSTRLMVKKMRMSQCRCSRMSPKYRAVFNFHLCKDIYQSFIGNMELGLLGTQPWYSVHH
nr:hypothetical protein Iba_chr10eCG5960 [Ipomoea batatas]